MKPEFQVYSDDDIMAVLRGISFPNSVVNFQWQFRCAPTTFRIEKQCIDIARPLEYDIKRGWLVWCEFYRPDVDTGTMGVGRGRDEIVLAGATESAIVKTAWLSSSFLSGTS